MCWILLLVWYQRKSTKASVHQSLKHTNKHNFGAVSKVIPDIATYSVIRKMSLNNKNGAFCILIFTDGKPETDNDLVDLQFPAWYYRDGFQYTVATKCGCAEKDWKVRKSFSCFRRH